MSESRTVFIPAFSLNYDNNMLESVGIGGEMFRRDTPLHAENSRLKAENAKLRELAKAAWGCVNRHVSCDECRMVCCGCTLQSAMRELGIEVN